VRGRRASIFRALISGLVTPLSRGDGWASHKGAVRVFVSKAAAYNPFVGRMVSGEAGTIHLAAKI